MLRSKQLSFSYDGRKVLEFPDLQCKPGESLLILGNSGTGKTTLLHLLAGLLKPRPGGSVWVGEENLTELTHTALDHFRGQHIGIIFQRSYFVSALNVRDNLRLAQFLPGTPSDGRRIETLLQRLNVHDKLQARTHRLSVGEQQRVAIARAVLNRPRILLADEPTSALDDENCEQVLQLLEEQAQEAGASLIIVTHDNRLKARIPNTVILD